ncbi:hypothetical protein EXIGLDRAFT_777583 [Exidia glandulosa HHB12029]|uniref:Uncharacterized protein n=1 Tax=Exidia glandulosa HHB12029 TaxID=1314781 RepID=A0A165CY85_EXIGL|nr:hypothetical protein EXIGLDRAFT_777583 [Exidia glandulosa HHB12029]
MSFSDPYGYIGNSPTLIGILEVWENYPDFTEEALRVCALRIAEELTFAHVAPAQLLHLANANAKEVKSCEQYAERLLVMASCLEREAQRLRGDDIATDHVFRGGVAVVCGSFNDVFECVSRHGLIGVKADGYAADPNSVRPLPPSTFFDALEMAMDGQGLLVPPPPKTAEEYEANDRGHYWIAYDVESSLQRDNLPSDNTLPFDNLPSGKDCLLNAVKHIMGNGRVREERNREAHQIRFRRFLVIAIHELDQVKKIGVPASSEWQSSRPAAVDKMVL